MPPTAPPNVHPAAPVPAFAPGVRDAIYQHVYVDPRNELGGLLVGDRRPQGDIVVGAIRADGARGDVTSLTFTQEAWGTMLGELDRRYPGAQVLGWYHSHPGHGIFLSRHDRFIHQHFFSAPWQVAIVVDPQRHEEGLFMWRPEGLVVVAGAPVDPAWSTYYAGAEAANPAPSSAPAPEAEPAPRPTAEPPAQTSTPAPAAPEPEVTAPQAEPEADMPPASEDPTEAEWRAGREASLRRRAERDRQRRRAQRFAAFSWLFLAIAIAILLIPGLH